MLNEEKLIFGNMIEAVLRNNSASGPSSKFSDDYLEAIIREHTADNTGKG